MNALEIAIRFALYIDLSLLFGLAGFGLYALPPLERVPRGSLPLCPLLGVAAVLGLFTSTIGLATLAAGMGGVSLAGINAELLGIVLAETAAGAAWLARVAALIVAVLLVASARASRRMMVGVTAAGAVALASLAWSGHGVMNEGPLGAIHLFADILHLLAAGIWIGAMVALLLLVWRPQRYVTPQHLYMSYQALRGFSVVGMIVVGLLMVTGLVNLMSVVGLDDVANLPTEPYGRLLVIKLALFVVMIGIGAANRYRLVPAFKRALSTQRHSTALSALRASLSIEIVCAAAILALVARLGMLDPTTP